MPYATAADVQKYVPTQIWTAGSSSQPTQATVEAWLTRTSNWVANTLRWRYKPEDITSDEDLDTLADIVAMLVADKVWKVIGGHGGELTELAKNLRGDALEDLGYSEKTGNSSLVLGDTSEASDSGPVATAAAYSQFPDRTFTREMVW